jgi:hypothetical protein
MGYIFYDPAGKKMGVGGGETVPATYDLGWTANEPPCLASPRAK